MTFERLFVLRARNLQLFVTLLVRNRAARRGCGPNAAWACSGRWTEIYPSGKHMYHA